MDFIFEDNSSDYREKDGFIKGLIVATVVDNVDEEGLARVRVKFPWHDDGMKSYWARLAMPMAMGSQGTFFLPEKDDEVLVGFEKGDPTHPYILGALWSGKAKPPETNKDKKNDVRVIKTRANSELRFFDGDPPSVELKLEDGKRLFMDDKVATLEDGQGNLFKIEASSGAISIVASGDMTLEGKSVTINSSSTVDVVASGTMTLKGATVQIN